MRSCRPGMSGRVGSPVRQPRSMSRRSASPRSPSAMTSSDERLEDLVGVQVGQALGAVPARVPRRAGRARRSASVARRDAAGRGPADPASRSPRAPASGVAVIGGRRSAGHPFLVEPAGEVEPLEQELDRRRHDSGFLGAVGHVERAEPATASSSPGTSRTRRRTRAMASGRRSRPRSRPRTRRRPARVVERRRAG